MKLEELYPQNPQYREVLPERFWGKVSIGVSDECWPWKGCARKKPEAHRKTQMQYGRFGLGRGRVAQAHRIAYMLAHGEAPDDVLICHSCDNPPCCNPAHLFKETAKGNAADRDNKGRWDGGCPPESARHRKLSPEDVISIRAAYALKDGATRQSLADIYGVNRSTVDRVVDGATWRDPKYWPDAVIIAISKPARIPSRERFAFSPDQVMANLDRMNA